MFGFCWNRTGEKLFSKRKGKREKRRRKRGFNMKDFVETRIVTAVRGLLAGKVNEILSEGQFSIPLIEFTEYRGGSVVSVVITLAASEQTEKERIIRLDAYTLTITFSFADTPESELYCYAYSGAVGKAVIDNPTLGGVVDRAVITPERSISHRKSHTTANLGD